MNIREGTMMEDNPFGKVVSLVDSNIQPMLSNNLDNDMDDNLKNTFEMQRKEYIYGVLFESLLAFYDNSRKSGLLTGQSVKEREKKFVDLFKNLDSRNQYFLEYPLLWKILIREENLFIEYCNELWHKYQEDKKDLFDKFRTKLGDLVNIKVSMGDRHQNKSVAIYEFENKKLVYKPRSTKTEEILSRVGNAVASFSTLPYHDFYFPKVLTTSDHSWHEFIQQKPCDSEIDVIHYYQQAGSFLAIFYVLGTTDLHYENIIAYGKYPVFIDTETLIKGNRSPNYKKYKSKDLGSSVLNTALLPVDKNGSDIDVNLSGLFNSKQTSKKIKTYKLVRNEIEDWAYSISPAVLKPMGNVVTLSNGDCIKNSEYYDYLIDGFTETLNLIIAHKNNIIKILTDDRYGDVKIRQLLRNTRVYAKFIETSYKPQILSSKTKFEELFDILEEKFQIQKHGYLRVESEINDLMNANIPYFYTKMSSKDLYSNGRLIAKNYFINSPVNSVIDRIESLDESIILYQSRLILMSLLTTEDVRSTKYLMPNKKNGSCLTNQTINQYTKYLDNISFSLTDSTKDFYTMVSGQDNRWHIELMPFGLYYTIGNIILLYDYGEKTNNFKLQNQAIKYYDGMINKFYAIEKMNKPEKTNLSVFEGISGLLYIAALMYIRIGDKKFTEHIHDIVAFILGNLSVNESKLDYISGISGIAVLFANMYDKNLVSMNEINKLNVILKKSFELQQPRLLEGDDFSLAHGSAGIGLGLAAMYSVTADEDLLEWIKGMVGMSVNNFNQVDTDNWCSGTTGILMAVKLVDDYVQDILNPPYKMISTVSKNQPQNSLQLGVCHGLIGEVLIHQRILKNKIDDSILKTYGEYDKPSKVYRTPLIENFMLGDAGILYNQLALEYNDIPVMQALEL